MATSYDRPEMVYAVQRLVVLGGEGSLKAYVDVCVNGELVIKGVRVVAGKSGLFVSMPRKQGSDSKWYDSVVLLTRQAQRELGMVVLEAYQIAVGLPKDPYRMEPPPKEELAFE